MKKRPLCMVCMILITIQAVRVFILGFGGEAFPPKLKEVLSCADCQSKSGTPLALSGTVCEIEDKEQSVAVLLKTVTVFYDGREENVGKTLLYVPKEKWDSTVAMGDVLFSEGEGHLFPSPRNPGEFDRRAYYARKGIYLYVYGNEMRKIKAGTWVVRPALNNLRRWGCTALRNHLGEAKGGIMCAVLFGDKAGLGEDTKLLYQKNGIAHLLAISGLHMSFLGAGIYHILRKMGFPFSLSGGSAGALLILYTLMTGGSASSFRALIMFLVRMGAEVSGREYDLPTSLSLSAALLTLWNPLLLKDGAFLFSYGAVAGILLLAPVFSELFSFPLGQGLSASCAVTVFLLGITLYFYYEVPPYSVVLNLLVIPLLPLAMGAALGGLLLLPVWSLPSEGLFRITEVVLSAYDSLCQLFSGFPASRFVTGRPCVIWLIIYYGVILSACLFIRPLKKRFPRLSGAALLLFASVMAFACQMWNSRPSELEITVMDVGQGDGIFVRLPTGEGCLIDGGSSDISSVGRRRMEPLMLCRGVDCLKYVFVTHGDSDHMNGILEMLENQRYGVRIDTLVLPSEPYIDDTLESMAEVAVSHGTKVKTMSQGDRVTFGEVSFTCLSPGGDSALLAAGNEASLVLSLEYRDFRMLFAGDVEGEGERLLSEGGAGRHDVLKAPHHGSKNSCSEEFLRQVSPEITLISAGVGNRYGHPHQETLDRLLAAGSKVYTTQESGALTIKTDGSRIRLEGFLSFKQLQ